MRQHARIEHWYISDNDQIVGHVYDHPKFQDGDLIITSRVVRFEASTGKAFTLNTDYELGEPRKEQNESQRS